MVESGSNCHDRNIAALWRVDPALAQVLTDLPKDDRVALEATRNGQWTLALSSPTGQSVYLHSRYDPGAEAEKFIASHLRAETYCYVVMGFGLGYHVRALFDAISSKAIVVVCEPSLEVVAAALRCVDLGDAIGTGRLLILWVPDKPRLHRLLSPRHALLSLGVRYIVHSPSQQVSPPGFYDEMRALLAKFLSFTRMSLSTLLANSQITCRNIAYNLPAYVSTMPIDPLRSTFAGYPAIVIAAGPSLAKNVKLLSQAKGKAVLCAAQTVLKPLIRMGVRPDFVTSLDFHEMSRRYFEGVGDLSDIHLVAEPKVTWHVVDAYPGPVSIVENPFAHLILGADLARRGGLKAGATVAHLAFYLARYLGCDPIIFVGLDLAFSDHLFYMPGVEIHDTWRSELNRFQTLEMKEFERILRNRPVLKRATDSDGRELFTDELLTTYREQFEVDFEQTTVALINATEGGVPLRGCPTMTLAECLQRYCTRVIPPEKYEHRAAARQRDPSRLGAAREEVGRRLDEVRTILEVCEKTSSILEELRGLVDDPPSFNRRWARVDEMRAVVTRHDRAYGLINAAAQLTELRRFTADLRSLDRKETGPDRALSQIARDLESVLGLRHAAEWMKETLTQTLARFDKSERGSPKMTK